MARAMRRGNRGSAETFAAWTAKVSADTITWYRERAEWIDQVSELLMPPAAGIRGAFEAAGIEFIEENGGGPGVRLKERLPKPV